MILGLHCSIREGLAKALDHAASLGARAVQIFPYQRGRDPEEEDYGAFRRKRQSSGIVRLYVHSRFVPNLALSDQTQREKSVLKLSKELDLAARLGADAFVLHLGAYSVGGSPRSGMGWAARSIAEARRASEGRVPICVENVPGGGRRLGGTLEELSLLAEALSLEPNAEPVSFCLDTAHAWAAGYEIKSVEGMSGFLEKAERLLGRNSIRLFHLNDTRAANGSHIESHAAWGSGALGFEALRPLFSSRSFKDRAGILESARPGAADKEDFCRLEALNG